MKRKKLFSFWISNEEMKLMKLKADIYTGGNVSHWLRYAATKLRPRGEDLRRD